MEMREKGKGVNIGWTRGGYERWGRVSDYLFHPSPLAKCRAPQKRTKSLLSSVVTMMRTTRLTTMVHRV